jgi:hypothetical protein
MTARPILAHAAIDPEGNIAVNTLTTHGENVAKRKFAHNWSDRDPETFGWRIATVQITEVKA